jgi:hypothetical protein
MKYLSPLLALLILAAPVAATAAPPAKITAIGLRNDGKSVLPAQLVSFGLVFAEGDLPEADRLTASIGGLRIPHQIDVKTHHSDHSVGWAIVTLAAPKLAATEEVAVTLSSEVAAAPTLPAAANFDDLQVTIDLQGREGTHIKRVIDVVALATDALRRPGADWWLNGPLLREIRLRLPIDAALVAQFDVRLGADGHVMTDISLQNDAIFGKSLRFLRYQIGVSSVGANLLAPTGVSQAPMQDWQKTLSSSAPVAPPRVIFDLAYLRKSHSVADYEQSTPIAASVIADEQRQLKLAGDDPLGNALVTRYQPTTGARPDIGPTTQWAADWLTSQSAGAWQVLLATAAVAAAIPIHARETDGRLVMPVNHPGFWLDSRNQGEKQTIDFEVIKQATGWTPDPAHMPDLAYVTALVSGRRLALDELQCQAAFDLLSIAPDYRAARAPLLGAQQRAIAWTLRDLANAWFLTPEGSDLRDGFGRELKDLLGNLQRHYVKGVAGKAQGALAGYVMGAFDSNQVAPWQQAYLALALAQAQGQGVAGADRVLVWMNGFLSGLYLQGANGYAPLNGSAYWLTIGQGSPADFRSLTDWRALYRANFAGQPAPIVLNGYPNDPLGGFSTIARAALAAAWTATGDPRDLAAFSFITQHSAALIADPGGFRSAQTWNISPKLADGHLLQNSEIIWGSGGEITARSTHSLLAAVSGDNHLQSGDGDSILIGGAGKDSLRGGAGDDFLFAGTGPQTLAGGAGRNYLEGHLNGGDNRDIFILLRADQAQDRIVNFQPGRDLLQIIPTDAEEILSNATHGPGGDLILHLGPQHDVTLQGIAALDAASFK